jgi:hypothetical protein
LTLDSEHNIGNFESSNPLAKKVADSRDWRLLRKMDGHFNNLQSFNSHIFGDILESYSGAVGDYSLARAYLYGSVNWQSNLSSSINPFTR